MGKGWRGILGQIAPTIAQALGGPLAGGVIKKLAGALLGNEQATEAEVEKAVLAADPSMLLKLRELETEYAKFVLDHGLNLEKLATEDRNSARNREASTKDSWTPRVLATVVVGGFLWTLYVVLAGSVPGMKDPNTTVLIGTLIGYASAKADQVISYYFGSSAGSDRKTEMMGKRTP